MSRRLLLPLILVLGAGACGAGQQPPVAHLAPNEPVWVPPPRPVWGLPQRECPPAAVVTLDTQETQDEIAIIFTTAQTDEGALREQVRQLADRINRGGQLDALPAGEALQPAPSPPPPSDSEPVQALAMVEPIEGGARLVLSAIDPAQEEQLREQVRGYALAATRCPAAGG